MSEQNKPLFTIVIPSYNHAKTLQESINSILVQNYENLELIITDDASDHFDKNAVQQYIVENRKENLKNTIVLSHEKNLGTVKNLKSAFTKAGGYYITAFAGDDCLYDENTISNYEKAFNENPKANIITAQSHRYDSELKDFLRQWVAIDRAYKLNESPARTQYRMLSETNTFSMGATAFKREIFEKHGYFDERYRLVEDWPLFLRLTRNGEKFHFVDFVALRHRDGGMSKRKNKENNLALNSWEFCVDLLAVFENEIFPHMREFTAEEKKERLTRYTKLIESNKDILTNTVYNNNFKMKTRLLLKYPVLATKFFLNRLR